VKNNYEVGTRNYVYKTVFVLTKTVNRNQNQIFFIAVIPDLIRDPENFIKTGFPLSRE